MQNKVMEYLADVEELLQEEEKKAENYSEMSNVELLTTLKNIEDYCLTTHFGNLALSHFGLPSIERDRYKYLVGNGYKSLIHGMLKEVGKDENDAIFDDIARFYHDEYDKNSMYLTKTYEGMPELIKSLNKKGIKLAVLSNKPHGAVKVVADELYGDVFDLCYGSREGVPLKPDPSMLFEILKDFDVSPEECVYVGDTNTDMQTGKSAGAFTVGVLWGFRDKEELEQNKADLIVSHPDEILKYIESV